uniref:DpnD/PcfM family protein n=1 Tax=[Lactobacillus] rogosae TaxID=706562 RepID=UPI00402AB9D8
MYFEVSYVNNSVCQANIYVADNIDIAEAYFKETRNVDEFIGISKLNNKVKSGQPVIEVPADYEPLFSVAVTETLRRDVTVRAKSKEEAYAQVERLYSNENIVLDADDLVESNINVYDYSQIDYKAMSEDYKNSKNSISDDYRDINIHRGKTR